jgi:hypothetical protein
VEVELEELLFCELIRTGALTEGALITGADLTGEGVDLKLEELGRLKELELGLLKLEELGRLKELELGLLKLEELLKEELGRLKELELRNELDELKDRLLLKDFADAGAARICVMLYVCVSGDITGCECINCIARIVSIIIILLDKVFRIKIPIGFF